MPRIKENKKGFTLFEMMISTFIIATLAAVTLVNYHSYGRKADLNMAAQKLASDIRRTQSYALSLKEFGGMPPDGGWGIFCQKSGSDYIIYIDANNNQFYNAGEEYDNIALAQGVNINDLLLDGTSRNNLYLTFEPPDPAVYICWNSAQCDNNIAEIELSNSAGEAKTIKVNKFGLVDVVN